MFMDYLIGFIITVLSILIFQLFGMCIVKNQKTYSYSFIIGFIAYSFLVAIVGIPIQIFRISWYVFFAYMLILIFAIIFYIIFNIYRKKIKINMQVMKCYFSENWFLYIGAFFILLLALGHLNTIWSNSLTDDGYYINKMSTLPFINNPFSTDPVTGFKESALTTYSLNTFELEGSFYIFISGLTGTLYARVFLALLNYFIMLNAIHAFLYKLFNFDKDRITAISVQFLVVPLFIILVMNSNFFVYTQEAWTITSAAYFGSALVRIACPFIVLLPLIGEERLNSSNVIITIMSCVVMVSKSTIAIPILFVLAIGYLLFILKRWYAKLILLVIVIAIGFILPNVEKVNTYILSYLVENIKILFPIVGLGCIVFFAFKRRVYLQLFIIVVSTILLLTIPEVNDTFEIFTNYSFVADRCLYSILVFVIIVGFGSTLMCVCIYISSKKAPILLGILSTILSFGFITVTKSNGVKLIEAGRVYFRNPNIVPQNVVKLGETLEHYYASSKIQPIVLVQPGIIVNGYSHFTASILRTFSPNSISVNAALRTQNENTNKESGFYGYSIEDIDVFSQFILDPNEQTTEQLKKLNETYQFNVIIGENFIDQHDQQLAMIGYEKYADLYDPYQNYTFNIYIKSEK